MVSVEPVFPAPRFFFAGARGGRAGGGRPQVGASRAQSNSVIVLRTASACVNVL
jgi:hypothetical protein